MADRTTPVDATRAFVIWKHRLITVAIAIALPEGARVIHVGPDPDGVPCIWEMHPDGAPPGPTRRFRGVFTGEPFPGGTHLGSWVAGGVVWHAFETTGTGAAVHG